MLIGLDGITDPHNLGAVVRSAAAFGADGVVIPERRNASMTGSAWKASAGAAARMPIAQVTNLVRSIEDAKKAGTKNIDRFPKNMLFARAMSNGVKWYTPDIYESPVYVPEEMESVTEETTAEVVETPTKRVLTPEQFEKLCAGIEAGQMATGSELTLYQWAVENVSLTDGQRLQIDVANEPKQISNDQNFVL